MSGESTIAKKSLGQRILSFIEQKGNKMWDPVSLFFVLVCIILLCTALCSFFGVKAVHPGTQKTIEVTNLLTKEGLQMLISTVTQNFQSFPPLGLVLIVMMGAGLADKCGLMLAFIRQCVLRAPKNLITAIVVFMGINAVAAGDAGFVVLPPLAAAVFLGVGRHPLAGLFTAYASVAAGFAACLIIQMGDVVAASFTIPAAQMIDPNYAGSPAMNYYFMFCSVFILLPTGVWVNNKVIEPRLGEYTGPKIIDDNAKELTDIEKTGLKKAGISLLILVVALILLSLGEGAFLADPKTGKVLGSNAPLMRGIVPIITLFFLIPGIVYGRAVGTIKSDKDAVRFMSSSVSMMGGYIVLAFAASQFLAVFGKSNLGAVLSIKGAEFLQHIGFKGIGLFLSFILLTSILNLFVGSAGAKWAIMAPIFVPMFMLLGYDPALTQACYRVGDSLTNSLSPLATYFPILLGYVRQYDEDAGLGTIISNMLPYSLAFAVVWIFFLVIFVVFDLPLGVGGAIHYILK